MPLFASTSQPGRALSRFGVGPPKFVEFLIMAGGGGRGGSAGPFYYERYKPWRTEFPGGCQPHYLGAVAGSPGGGGGYISSVIGELSGRNSSPVPVLEPTPGTAYPISIGGAGGNSSNGNGGQGGSTSAFGYTAIGGGGGGRPGCCAGSNGGSGGSGGGGGGGFPCSTCGGCSGGGPYGSSAGGAGTANQGFPGVVTTPGGAGGAPTGIFSSITGTSVERCTGYGNHTEGSASTRGGVICRYQGKDPEISAGLSYSLYTVGSYQVLELKTGTGTIRW
jgi:hypothetical protein